MRAVLEVFIRDHTQVELPVDLGDLKHGRVEVKSENFQGASDLKLSGQVGDQVESQVLVWGGLLVCIGILIVLPANFYNRLGKRKAPIILMLSIIETKDTKIFASLRANIWVFTSGHSLFVSIN